MATGAMEDESPQDDAGPSIMEQLAERRAARHARDGGNSQHAVMKKFMRSFANNMRLSVLSDSKGDMPEAQRQRLIAKAEAQKEGAEPPPQEMPPPEAEASEEMAEPPPQQRAPRRHMINMAEARHRRMPMRHRLLPDAEGIGFPAPEGMAPDPATEGMTNDPGSTSFGSEPAEEYEAPPPRRPPPRRHHLRMLNMRPGEHDTMKPHHARAATGHSGSRPKLPPCVVRDEMGRPMPLLFTGSNPAHSGAFHATLAPLAAMAVALVFLRA